MDAISEGVVFDLNGILGRFVPEGLSYLVIPVEGIGDVVSGVVSGDIGGRSGNKFLAIAAVIAHNAPDTVENDYKRLCEEVSFRRFRNERSNGPRQSAGYNR